MLHLVQETNINAVLTEELASFQLRPANTISFPTWQAQGSSAL
jgi:hypothetical protein